MKIYLLLLCIIVTSVSAFATNVPIYRFKINPNQADDLDTIFRIDSSRLESLPKLDSRNLRIDYSKAARIAKRAALSEKPNLGKYRIDRVELIEYYPDRLAYLPLKRQFFLVCVQILTEKSDKSESWMIRCYLVFQDGTFVEGNASPLN